MNGVIPVLSVLNVQSVQVRTISLARPGLVCGTVTQLSTHPSQTLLRAIFLTRQIHGVSFYSIDWLERRGAQTSHECLLLAKVSRSVGAITPPAPALTSPHHTPLIIIQHHLIWEK